MMAPQNRYKLEDFGKNPLKSSFEKQSLTIKEKLEILIHGYIKKSGSGKREVTTTLSETEMITFAQPNAAPGAAPEAVVFQPKQTQLVESIDEPQMPPPESEPVYIGADDVKTIFERVLTKDKDKTASDGR